MSEAQYEARETFLPPPLLGVLGIPLRFFSAAENEAFYTGERGFQNSDAFLALLCEIRFKIVTLNFFFLNVHVCCWLIQKTK